MNAMRPSRGTDGSNRIASTQMLTAVRCAGSSSFHDSRGVLILEQGQQEVFERGVLVMPLVRQGQGPVKRLFEAARKSWHYGLMSFFSQSSPGPSPPRI